MNAAEPNPGASSTRQLLLSSAEQLFAEHGLEAVSLSSINRAAGQRNAAALHYHFGNRDGLIQAIFDKHVPRVGKRRAQMYTQMGSSPSASELVEALILPLAEHGLDPDGGACYLLFLWQIASHPGRQLQTIDRRQDPLLERQRHSFRGLLSHLDDEAAEIRQQLMVNLVFSALAELARRQLAGPLPADEYQRWVGELVVATVGCLGISR